ncbi:MAG: arginine deiminase [Bacteroidales bacterium]|nr:arginine deiminase [Bacteroidales bacterium]
MAQKIKNQIFSEIGKLEDVILHTPGPEVENMTPQNAERALYSDILNLQVARRDYSQFHDVLQKLTNVHQVRDLLTEILNNPRVKEDLVGRIIKNEGAHEIMDNLLQQDSEALSRQLIEGVVLTKDNLTKYLSRQRYSIRPLHNFFFTRDAAVTIHNKVLINRMASKVRERESMIMEAIFDYHPRFQTKTVNPVNHPSFTEEVSIEGGDVLIAREDVFLIGIGDRTTSQGIDFIIEKLKTHKSKRHILVQELPLKPESFIHLDMVFTFLDKDACMVYEPVILKPNRLQTVHIEIDNGKVCNIYQEENLLQGLKKLGMDLKPIYCGGNKDLWTQEREQWHSGANFLSLEPGKVIGYERNTHTIEEMNNHGFEIIPALDIINDKVKLEDYKRAVITVEGSELPRGGGGARCMSMPVNRKPVKW